jgi:hypothetical protein
MYSGQKRCKPMRMKLARLDEEDVVQEKNVQSTTTTVELILPEDLHSVEEKMFS